MFKCGRPGDRWWGCEAWDGNTAGLTLEEFPPQGIWSPNRNLIIPLYVYVIELKYFFNNRVSYWGGGIHLVFFFAFISAMKTFMPQWTVISEQNIGKIQPWIPHSTLTGWPQPRAQPKLCALKIVCAALTLPQPAFLQSMPPYPTWNSYPSLTWSHQLGAPILLSIWKVFLTT